MKTYKWHISDGGDLTCIYDNDSGHYLGAAFDSWGAKRIVEKHNEQIEKLKKQLADCGGPRMCLNCGAEEPCDLKDDPCSPCTFDPTYPEAVQMWKDMKAQRDVLEAKITAIVEYVREAANDGEDDIYEVLGAVCNIAEGGKYKEIE